MQLSKGGNGRQCCSNLFYDSPAKQNTTHVNHAQIQLYKAHLGLPHNVVNICLVTIHVMKSVYLSGKIDILATLEVSNTVSYFELSFSALSYSFI